MGFTTTFDARGLDRLSIDVSKKVIATMMDEVTRQSRRLTNFIITRHLTGGTTTERLAVRSGMLRRTTRPKKTVRKGNDIVGGTTFGVSYAIVHIGKRGSFFTINRTSSKGTSFKIKVPRRVHPEVIIKNMHKQVFESMRKRLHKLLKSL